MKSWNLPPMPFDVLDYSSVKDLLSDKESTYYIRLLCHYWRFGELEKSDEDLAVICGVQLKTFMKARNRLVKLFEIDEDGSWRDHELEADREIAFRKSDARARAGKSGGLKRWEEKRIQGETEVEAKAGAAETAPDPIEFAIANAIANAPLDLAETLVSPIANAPLEVAETLVLPMANAMAPPASHGSIDRSFLESKEEIDRSIDARDAPAKGPFAIAGAMANGIANAIANSIEESAAKPSADPGEAEVLPLAQAIAKAVTAPLSINGRGPAPGLSAAPSTAAAAAPPSSVNAGPPDEELFRLLRKACGTNVREALFLHPKEIIPIRELIRDGYDLDREILPALADRVPHLKKPLGSFRPSFIREAVDEARQATSKRPVQPQASDPQKQKVFVAVDTPQWLAWKAYAKKSGKVGYPDHEMREGRGFLFDAPWPPGYEPSASVAAQ